ncbi:hypothetical protein MMC22_009126 [Lobaria immixta]|nr:hypothetical protein [Lobaria immixta]
MTSYLIAGAGRGIGRELLDVLRQSDVDAATETVRKTTCSIDVLIFNPGVATGNFLAQCSMETVQEMLDLNSVGPHRRRRAEEDYRWAPALVALHFMVMLFAADLTPAEGILFASVDPEIFDTSGASRSLDETPGFREMLDAGTSPHQMISARESVEGILKVVEGLT